MNSVTEKEVLSDPINKRIQVLSSRMKTLLYNCLKAAQGKKEISKKKDIKALADYLFCFLAGLMIMGRSNTDKGALKKLVDVAFSAIKN